VIEDIRRCCFPTRVIFVSTHTSKDYVNEAFERGACGYVVKGNAARELITAVNIAVAGHSVRGTTEGLEPAVPVGEAFAHDSVEALKPVSSARGHGDGTSRSPRFPSSLCAEGQQLFRDFGQAIELLLKLLQDQLNAVTKGDPAANRFDLLIHQANERKQDTKYSYLHHLHTHGCDAAYGIEHCGS
jgi:hypothetical protein